MAQWQRSGPLTQMPVDRNYLLVTPELSCAVNFFFEITELNNIEYLILSTVIPTIRFAQQSRKMHKTND